MQLLTRAPKGTLDTLPKDIIKWQTVEQVAFNNASLYGFKEIRTPVFEHTELFVRSVGNETDVVSKEMYTFEDKGKRSITLRPEMTAGVARAVTESGLINEALPLKVCYVADCFRYERPQAGRMRQFKQFGAEVFGAEGPSADAEIIAMASGLFDTLGIKNLSLEINSIGCKECRKKYIEALKEFCHEHEDSLCPTCKERMDKNPMRVLDCKVESCKEVLSDAPFIIDYLCDDCKEHFEGVQNRLLLMGIPYNVNPHIVRGLDYYTRTVFEFVSNEIGSQGTVCGGGRYDGLIEQIGGPKTCGLGFAVGINRLILLMEAQNTEFMPERKCELYLAPLGEKASKKAVAIADLLRKEGFYVETDLMGRSVKAQMKYADKIGAMFSAVIGDDEIESGKCVIKKMSDGTVTEAMLEKLPEAIYDLIMQSHIDDAADAGSFIAENK